MTGLRRLAPKLSHLLVSVLLLAVATQQALHRAFSKKSISRHELKQGEITYFQPPSLPYAEEMVNFIGRHQNPSDCQSAKFLVWRWRPVECGMGSDLHVMTVALAAALATQRVLVLHPGTEYPWTPWAIDSKCPTHNLDCFTKPLSHCELTTADMRFENVAELSPAQLDAAITLTTSPTTTTPNSAPDHSPRVLMFSRDQDFLDRYRGLIPPQFSGKLGSTWVTMNNIVSLSHWRAVGIAYILRWNGGFDYRIRSAISEMLPTASLPPCITVHIRHGDKKAEMKLLPLSDYIAAVKKMKEDYPELRHIDTIFLTTDDGAVVDQVGQYPEFHFIVTDHSRNDKISYGELARREGYNITMHAFIDLELALQCRGFVVTTASNWSRLIEELRMIRGKWNTPWIDLIPGTW